jgi:hypothetical protein
MVTESLSLTPGQTKPPRLQSNVRKITFSQWSLAYSPRLHGRQIRHQTNPKETPGNIAMTHRFAASVVAFGLLVALAAAGSARAELATPEQKKACTPDALTFGISPAQRR